MHSSPAGVTLVQPDLSWVENAGPPRGFNTVFVLPTKGGCPLRGLILQRLGKEVPVGLTFVIDGNTLLPKIVESLLIPTSLPRLSELYTTGIINHTTNVNKLWPQ